MHDQVRCPKYFNWLVYKQLFSYKLITWYLAAKVNSYSVPVGKIFFCYSYWTKINNGWTTPVGMSRYDFNKYLWTLVSQRNILDDVTLSFSGNTVKDTRNEAFILYYRRSSYEIILFKHEGKLYEYFIQPCHSDLNFRVKSKTPTVNCSALPIVMSLVIVKQILVGQLLPAVHWLGKNKFIYISSRFALENEHISSNAMFNIIINWPLSTINFTRYILYWLKILFLFINETL